MSAYPVEFNGTSPNGGDSLTEDLNIYYNVRVVISSQKILYQKAPIQLTYLFQQAGDIAWMITSSALVLLMIPGVGYAYKNACLRVHSLLTKIQVSSTLA